MVDPWVMTTPEDTTSTVQSAPAAESAPRPDHRPILVGVDGSDASRAAIDLGVLEARVHNRPLRLVHVFVWPLTGVYLGPSPEGPGEGGLAADADLRLADSLAQASAKDPDLPVSGEVITGEVAPVLLGEAQHAEMTVIGDRGLGGFTGLLLGSVAVQLAAHAPGPVLVARGEASPGGPVVIGVDGSASSALAVEFAFAEATARGADVEVVNVWSGKEDRISEALPLVYNLEDVEAEQTRLVTDWIADARERFPDLPVRLRIEQGRTASTLVDASQDAQLVVVGARGRGGFAGLLLGSVSQAVLHHAHCPVTVVRGRHGSR
jgi:nucleotide-binding universal stress UspA family protein